MPNLVVFWPIFRPILAYSVDSGPNLVVFGPIFGQFGLIFGVLGPI